MRDDVPAPGRLIEVDGHRMHLLCIGSGSPTVVFDAGLSDAWISWVKVQPAVAEYTRACFYDRAGIGYSDPGPAPRTSNRIAAELHELLRAADVAGPWVLVGHSFGGLNIRRFAGRDPDEVAGLVFVDASHPDQVERFPAELGNEEGLAFDESAGQVRNSALSRDVPLVVISAGKHPTAGVSGATAEAMERAWAEMQLELVSLLPQGTQVVATNSGHYVQREQPQLVIDAILQVLEQVRRRGAPAAAGRAH